VSFSPFCLFGALFADPSASFCFFVTPPLLSCPLAFHPIDPGRLFEKKINRKRAAQIYFFLID
jgi:hypothetical protein